MQFFVEQAFALAFEEVFEVELFVEFFASQDASTFLAVAFALDFFAEFLFILEFLPNIVFTSHFQGRLPCNNIMGKINISIHLYHNYFDANNTNFLKNKDLFCKEVCLRHLSQI